MKSVALTANGAPVATVGHTPYEFTYTPAYDQIGDIVTLAATITDSSGQTSVVSTEVKVPGDHDRRRPAPSAAPSRRRSR